MTDQWYGNTLATEAVEEFLNDQGTGVLSLTNEGRAYGIPVAFAYDADDERAVLDLGFAPESKKREFIEATEEVCLTVYEHDAPDDWTSVVLTGGLEELEDEEVSDDTEAWFASVAGDIDVDDANLDLQWYAIDAKELSGRTL